MSRITSESIEKFRAFASSEHVPIVLHAIARLLTIPKSYKKDTEYDTVYAVAMLDGEKEVMEKFINLINSSMNGNIEELQVLDERIKQ